MQKLFTDSDTVSLFKNLGFPDVSLHHSFNHFDFLRASRRILVIGPMGSGKTEYSARVWRDSEVALKKSSKVSAKTTTNGADRRKVFFVRSSLDALRFPDCPSDALAYRGGYISCGNNIAKIINSFELEQLLNDNPDVGTWIIDEATFYDERIAYVIKRESKEKGRIFIFPSLILNFRKDIFNQTARILLEEATDIFPLSAYCEQKDCIKDSFYTYRFYLVDNEECPALYFDPLIIIGGDTQKNDPQEPNYCTRCDAHHYLPGKEYTYLTLKPMGVQASRGRPEPLQTELKSIKNNLEKSLLFNHFKEQYGCSESQSINMNALKVDCIAERALMFLFTEQNLLTEEQFKQIVSDIDLHKEYIIKRLKDNGRTVCLY